MKKRILLADDSVTIQKVIELTFMDEDYDVRAVSNGDDAIAALSDISPDFVIADVHMPGANGYEVCRRAKAMRADLPVLLLVGTFEPFDEGQARAVGADSFLKKPFDSQELLQRVDELLAWAPSGQGGTELPLSHSEPMAQAAGAPATEPLPEWPEVQAEPEDELLSMPPLEPLEDLRPAVAAPSPFLDEESPFLLDDDRSALAAAAPETVMPAGEPIFELDSPLDSPELSLGEPLPAVGPGPAGFATTPEERLGIPQDAAPLLGSLAETEARIEAPAPPSISAAHEPETSWPAAPISPISPTPPTPPPPPLAAPLPAPLPVGSVTPVSANGGGLSDADVDRIARRVAELIGDKAIRDVAWEVIPDLAEVVIRDRLRELESQVEDL